MATSANPFLEAAAEVGGPGSRRGGGGQPLPLADDDDEADDDLDPRCSTPRRPPRIDRSAARVDASDGPLVHFAVAAEAPRRRVPDDLRGVSTPGGSPARAPSGPGHRDLQAAAQHREHQRLAWARVSRAIAPGRTTSDQRRPPLRADHQPARAQGPPAQAGEDQGARHAQELEQPAPAPGADARAHPRSAASACRSAR